MLKEVLLFLVPFKVIFLTRFDVFLDLVILPYFNAISTGFYAVKCLINNDFYLCNCHVFKWETAYIKD